ncbi:uncharacterized protein A4U43_C07F15660 [Asparagus officinalis]|uniref:RNA-dependent RNA polymerase n=1 Tax=Asparagus officinalis TaxID=4686 RepID=A0A5P1EE74_ASPOF|nr:uncharacterized protein A4U43_C07F15660 [Asparagus officinalis]
MDDKCLKLAKLAAIAVDFPKTGVFVNKCLKLAKLAAIAVDFPKTGVFVKLLTSYKPKVYPDFMNTDEHITYKSEKIIGRLYRKIKSASDEDNSSELISLGNQSSYDRQLNALLGQFRVDKEGEVVTRHICSLGSYNSRKQGEIKERLKNAYYALNKKYRRSFEEIGGHLSQLSDDERNQIYESKAASWYQVTYHPK